MKKLIDINSPVMIFLSRVADLIILNWLWIICSLPIITIGASTSAMYTVLRQIADENDSGVVTPFFHAFRRDFIKATGLFVCLTALGVFVVLNAYLAVRLGSFASLFGLIPFVFYFFAVGYVFPLFVRFENSLFQTLKNAVVISIANLGTSLLALGVQSIPIVLIIIDETLFWKSLIIWAFIGFSATAFFLTVLVKKAASKHLCPTVERDSPDDD